MSDQVVLTSEEKYAQLHVTGPPLTLDEIKDAILRVIEEAVASKLEIMIVREEPGVQLASITNFYEFAGLFAESDFDGKLALVFPGEKHHEKLEFFEITAKNRGVDVKLFSSKKDARSWLCGEGDRGAT